jgi:type IV pilus assembly protein PilM
MGGYDSFPDETSSPLESEAEPFDTAEPASEPSDPNPVAQPHDAVSAYDRALSAGSDVVSEAVPAPYEQPLALDPTMPAVDPTMSAVDPTLSAVEPTPAFEHTHADETTHDTEPTHAPEPTAPPERAAGPELPSDTVSQAALFAAVGESALEPQESVPADAPFESAEVSAEQTGVDMLQSAPAASERRRRVALRREPADKPAKRAKEPKEKEKRAKKLVGLKIGASQIAAARVVNNGVPDVVEAMREPLEPGLVVAGEIRDAEALGAALQRFFERHKLPKKGVRLGVANNRIGVRVFEIEGITEQLQLENAIRFRAEEVLPIPLDQAVLDYVVLDEADRPDGTPFRRILLVVAYREVVDRYLEACRSAGIEVVGIDLEAFALLRSLAAPADRDQSQGALVAVAVGHDRTTIAVSTGRYCEFTRVLDWGGWSLNIAVARELDRAPSEVEAIKRQLSFSQETEVDGLAPEKVAKTRDGVQRALAAFARELVASLHFYQAQPGALGIGEIVLTGGTAHMDGFPEALGRLIGVPVRLGDPFVRVRATPALSQADSAGSLAVAVGLGIED